MTMKRSEKAEHQDVLANVSRDGKVGVEFESPALIARHGHKMTPAQYREHRMGRRAQDAETGREIKLDGSRFRKINRRG